MWSRVQVTTPPAVGVSPVSVKDLAYRLKITTSVDDDVDDSEASDLADFIAAGVALFDGPDGVGYACMKQAWTLSLDHFPPLIRLPGAPIKRVSSVKYLDANGVEQTLPEIEFQVDVSREPAMMRPAIGKSWPATYAAMSAIKIEYDLGEEDPINCDRGLISAIMLNAGHLYAHREGVVLGTISGELPMGISMQLKRLSRIPVSV